MPRPVPMVPVAKPRGKMTSPPSQQSTPHYANQTTTNNHSEIFCLLRFTVMKTKQTDQSRCFDVFSVNFKEVQIVKCSIEN